MSGGFRCPGRFDWYLYTNYQMDGLQLDNMCSGCFEQGFPVQRPGTHCDRMFENRKAYEEHRRSQEAEIRMRIVRKLTPSEADYRAEHGTASLLSRLR